MVIFVAVATVISTFLGGLFAIRFKDKLHLILGFSAGAVIGVAFFDLLPESFKLATTFYSLNTVTILMASGFAFLMLMDRIFSIHMHDQDECKNPRHKSNVSAVALILHSFLDGLAIGLAFKISPAVGWVIALAVMAHDFSDGINTVNIILKNQGNRTQAFKWLITDAIAPALGVVTAYLFTVSEPILGLILSIFTGFFFFIGASDLIPESHHRHPSLWTSIMTIAGIVFIYLAIRIFN